MVIFSKHSGIMGGGGSLGLVVAVDLEVVDFCAGLQRAAAGETILDVSDAAGGDDYGENEHCVVK
jgi:hypothetical protein